MLVPLAQVEMAAIVAEVGAGELRAGDPLCLRKSFPGNVSTKIAIIFGTFTDGKPKIFAGGNRRPRNSGSLGFFEDCPCLHIDRINAAQVARSHPQPPPMRGKRLRCRCRRRKSLSFTYPWQCFGVHVLIDRILAALARSAMGERRCCNLIHVWPSGGPHSAVPINSSDNSDRLSLREFERCAACSAPR